MVINTYKKSQQKRSAGQIITFYSYKGGVGRSLALANIAALLVKWGKRVLVIDWDLEAPGLENYYAKFLSGENIDEKIGLIDLLTIDHKTEDFNADSIPWEDYIFRLNPELDNLYIITSGKKNNDYAAKVRALNISKFFEEDGGSYLESLREYWRNDFDFVFIDSRTGLTDNSGVCSIHMPDVLVLLFTLNEQSLKGSMEVGLKAANAHLKIIYDRLKLKILPVPTRIENNESKRKEEWLERISEELVPFFDWLPREKTDLSRYSLSPKELINQIKVPYLPEYAYGEQLPVVEKGTSDPQDIGFVYETIAAIFANSFNKLDLLGDSRDKFIKIAKGELKEEINTENFGEWLQFLPNPRMFKNDDEWHVFLSYTTDQRGWAIALHEVLTMLGYRVFIDVFELNSGDNLAMSLETALEKSQSGILIWSPSTSNKSNIITKEYGRLEYQAQTDPSFTLVPIIVGDQGFTSYNTESIKLPTFLSTRVFIDFSGYPDGPNGGGLIRLLYAITGIPIPEKALEFANLLDEITPIAFAKVNVAIKNNNSERLLILVEEGGIPWRITASLGCKAAEGLSKMGKLNDSIDLLEKLEKAFKKSLRVKQLKAFALLRRSDNNDLSQAQAILSELYAKNYRDPVTLEIFARSWYTRYSLTGEIACLVQSRNLYSEAFEKATDDYYLGINAASKSLLLGTADDVKKAEKYASRVQDIIGIEAVPGDYWKTATIAEVLLIQRKFKEAGEMYEKAVEIAKFETSSHHSTYMQARKLMAKLLPTDLETEFVSKAFVHKEA